MILIVDFGSQTTHLISRRLKDLGVPTAIVIPSRALSEIKKISPDGIILSGGPSGVYEKNAPTIDKKIFDLHIPILAICYGLQLAAHLLGGKVVSGRKEYGPAELEIGNWKLEITAGLPKQSTVWMSHGDEIIKLPKGFEILGTTPTMPFAFVENKKLKLYGVQFHPEAEHTEFGNVLLKNFSSICGVKQQNLENNEDVLKDEIRKKVGDAYVIGAISGGVDSTVAGTLVAEAIGDRFIPIFVDTGLMREGTAEDVKKIFEKHHVKPIIAQVENEMLRKLKGITEPEKKRKIIGAFFIEIFEREMKRLKKEGKHVEFLLQGTLYSDVIESKGTIHADKIKSHHNVGGLPEHMKLKLLEPLSHLYKDEVRLLGKKLGIPEEFVQKQKFPGPGYGIRIRGEVTEDRLKKAKQADNIILEELKKAKLLHTVFHSFPVMTGAFSTAVKGDGNFFGEVIALRITTSSDEMTCGWAHLPYEVLQKISSRIVNEVPEISRVVYDITTKPPATMEWE